MFLWKMLRMIQHYKMENWNREILHLLYGLDGSLVKNLLKNRGSYYQNLAVNGIRDICSADRLNGMNLLIILLIKTEKNNGGIYDGSCRSN